MRTSVAGPIAAYMQHQAILSRHEDTREALAQIGARSGVAARFREVRKPYCLGPTVDSDPSEGVDSTRCKSASMLHVGVGL